MSTDNNTLPGYFLREISSLSKERSNANFALVTGASSGIGLAIAEELAKRKFNLVLVALPATGLEGVAWRLSQTYPVTVYTFCADLTDRNSSHQLFEACQAENITLQILVNNAGFGNLELFETSDLTELLQMMTLNNQALV